jgi:glucoamylase
VEDARVRAALDALVGHDLAFVLARWREPAYDMWEEERGLHYHTLCVSAAALEAGAGLRPTGQQQAARVEAHHIRTMLDEFWRPGQGFYASRLVKDGDPARLLDISVVFAAIHAWNGDCGAHTAGDPRIHATLDALAELFRGEYAINRDHGAGPAMGRYRGDRYFSGGAYYFSTLAAAELCFRAALPAAGGEALRWRARGDAFLETVRAFTPATGDLSEQFDQRTGEQTSARHLAWSYAAFISCHAARRAALAVA